MATINPIGLDVITGKKGKLESGDSLLGSNTRIVTQASHGFSALSAIRYNGTTWVAAQSNSENTLADGIVIVVLNLNSFIVADSGFFNITAHGLIANNWYFLSSSSAGALTDTAPSEFVQPLVKALDANTIRVYSSVGSLGANGISDLNSGNGTLEIVGADVVTSGSKMTLTVSGLDTVSFSYLCEYNLCLSSASTTKARLFFNGDTSMTGYTRNDSISNNSELFTTGMVNTSQRRSGFLEISENTATGFGKTPYLFYRVIAGSDSHGYIYKNANEGVSQFSIASDNSAWAVGSYLRIYKRLQK